MAKITPLIAALLIAHPAHAATEAYKQCMDKAGSNMEFSTCSGQEIERQEAALNGTWKKLVPMFKSLPPESYKELLEEQRNWIKYKDSACGFYSYGFGREGHVLHYGACKIGVIEQREQYLSRLMDELQ